ncbi:phosphoketolase family protein [Neoactinobaculum massilliense]|uniref:phosphoketolase family protein n=1 Tax=Neoactinobaculum massilliense TaxID=2364794 RepID=UPI000F52D95F|nr:phosphoketolase family protein [Neoactinobaculum massilliense]
MGISPELIDHLKHPTDDEVKVMDAWWRADNYLTVGQIYLQSNPLLKRDLTPDDIKPRLLGHWGTSPGLSFIYAHVSRLIRLTGQNMIYITGPGHGGPAIVGATYLEGSYTEAFPKITRDEPGLLRLFRQFSQPGGIPSHVAVTTPGSINEGGELGYALVHAFGSVFDNPDLITVAVVGDGEAETAPLEGSWKGISYLSPSHDGAVLPILHLNGAKISSPTVQARKDPAELRKLYEGHGYEVIEVSGSDIPGMHRRFDEALATAYAKIKQIQADARELDADGVMKGEKNSYLDGKSPRWPMIILRTPKGWTGPSKVDGVQVEGTWRAHQVPLAGVKENADHLKQLQEWMESYHPEELFDENGYPRDIVLANNPEGDKRLSANPVANGGGKYTPLDMPDWRESLAFNFPQEERGKLKNQKESTRYLGEFMAELYRRNPTAFRLFCPDETNSNRLGAVFDVSDRAFMENITDEDVKLGRSGRVMEVLSEHNTHGWLEGYTLTGRHGLFASYEAFGMVSLSQTIQHGKWLEEGTRVDWRVPVPSLNLLLTSTAWRNDHNGFSHQGPGVLSSVLNLRGDVVRVYLPVDANSLLDAATHVFNSRDRVNLIVQDKQFQFQWLTPEEAAEEGDRGYAIWDWAGNEVPGSEKDPDMIFGCAGDIVTAEAVAAAQIIREKLPEMTVRVVNVVRPQVLLRHKDHPTGLSQGEFREAFTDHVDCVFTFHGYPGTVHQLLHGRPDADRFHARGYIEEGTTTTPFDMVVRNRVDRFHLVIDAINNCKRTIRGAADLKRWCQKQLAKHEEYKVTYLQDMPEVRNWEFKSNAELEAEKAAK